MGAWGQLDPAGLWVCEEGKATLSLPASRADVAASHPVSFPCYTELKGQEERRQEERANHS